MSKFFRFFLVFLVLIAGSFYSYGPLSALEDDGGDVVDESEKNFTGKSLQDELDDVKKKLEKNRKQQQEYKVQIQNTKNAISSYNNEVDVLENEINLLNGEIEEKELVIAELELEVQIIGEDIIDIKEEMVEAESQIGDLEEETDYRLLQMYIVQKQQKPTSSVVLSKGGASGMLKETAYMQAVQSDTNEKIKNLKKIRDKLEDDRIQLEEYKITIDRNNQQMKEERLALDRRRVEADNKKQAYVSKIRSGGAQINSMEKILAILPQEEKNLLKRQDEIQAALLARSEVASGLPVTKGTFLGIEGNTGYSYGAHLHFGVSNNGVVQNPCSYLPAGAYGGCGGSGSLGIPLSPKGVLTSGFRTANRRSHNAVDLSTGGGGSVLAAHDGYVYFFFEPCPAWAKVCNGGGAIVAKVCSVDKCQSGISTVYYHLSCTAEPSSSPRSCK